MEIAENNEEALVGADSRKRKAANTIDRLTKDDTNIDARIDQLPHKTRV
jgi:hypothetical protein